MRRLVLVALIALAITGCASGPYKPGPNDGASLDFSIKATIVIDDGGIQVHVDSPPLRVGHAITVTNKGTKEHGLTSDSIDTGTLRPGESTTVFLTAEGTVELYDRADTSHKARIEVAAEASS